MISFNISSFFSTFHSTIQRCFLATLLLIPNLISHIPCKTNHSDIWSIARVNRQSVECRIRRIVIVHCCMHSKKRTRKFPNIQNSFMYLFSRFFLTFLTYSSHFYSEFQSRTRRRRVAPMAQELLFGSDVTNGNNRRDDEMSRSFTIYDSGTSNTGNGGNSFIPLARVPSAPGSLKDHNK